ncbi:ATP-binding protein [Actinoplanes sp. NPDC020271]|uniref:ATP-binding protein n=1 Tax=Actinoplanes sp. NPDC020271 TaxID=3363896 RepID=UPI00379A2D5C
MSVRVQILGPLRLWRDDVELDTGPRQQACLLALLAARAGRPVSTDELVDLIWGEDVPGSALNVIHKYIGALRRLFEPDLPAREAGAHVLRRGTGYMFSAGPGTLDLVAFRAGVAAARTAVAEDAPAVALDHYLEALALWHGPAGHGVSPQPIAMSAFSALDAEFHDACVAAAGLAVRSGRAEAALPALRLAAATAPLHEPVHAGLVAVLGAAGHRSEALAAYREVRARLRDDLGIEPGPALREAHLRILAPAAEPAAPRPAVITPRGRGDGLVGRAGELTVLRQTLDTAFAGGTGLVLVEGEPGVGKTRLLEEVAAEAGRRGALTVRSSGTAGDGTPSMWPWVRAIGAILDSLPAPVRDEWLAGQLGRLVKPGHHDVAAAPVLPDNGAQFRLFEQVVALVGQASARRPVLLVVDDLQWADAASLELFGHLTARLPRATVLAGALRDRAPAPGTELSRMLAAVSRVPGQRRVRLGPLDLAGVAELMRRENGREPDIRIARSVHGRTAGNPFFVRELSRLLADGGAPGDDRTPGSGVPATVRDVVLDRMSGLDDNARDLLRIAALVGPEVDVVLVAGVGRIDVETCLARLEPVEALGLLAYEPEDPFFFRFAHDLVREAVSETTPPHRAKPLHLRIADALEGLDPGDESVAERLAHHLWAAGPLAGPARTANALIHAGRRATAKAAFGAAERHLRSAAQVARTAGLAAVELDALVQLTTIVGMRSMYAGAALDLMARAEHLARELGREREATDFLFSRWAAHAQAIELDRSGPLARQLLDRGEASDDPVLREYGVHAWGIHQWSIGNIGTAFRYLSRSGRDLTPREQDPLRHDLQLLSAGMLAETTALHGDVDGAWAIVDAMEKNAGDDTYVLTVWAAFAARISTMIGDPGRALRAAERGIAADPEFAFGFLGTYQRLARCWAQALTGQDPEGAAAEAGRLIETMLLDPPRSCVATWFGLLGEMLLVAGALDEAGAALDRAGRHLEAHGQRYPEGLLLLFRARLLHARGEPDEVVRAAAEEARRLSTRREAHLFARRAGEFLATLG